MATFWQQGSTDVAFPLTVLNYNNVAVNLGSLLASAITPRLKRTDVPDPAFWSIAGSVTIVSASAGTITITFAAADVATPGNYLLDVQVNFGAGALLTTPPQVFTIVPA